MVGIAQPKQPLRIQWKNGTETYRPMNPAQIRRALISLAARKPAYPGALPPRHLVVQFDRPILPEERDNLWANGLRLLQPFQPYGYSAAIHHQTLNPTELARFRPLKGVRAFKRKWKLGPLMHKGKFPDHAIVKHGRNPQDHHGLIVAVTVWFPDDVPMETEAEDVVRRHEATIRCRSNLFKFMQIEISRHELFKLADEDAIEWIQLIMRLETQAF